MGLTPSTTEAIIRSPPEKGAQGNGEGNPRGRAGLRRPLPLIPRGRWLPVGSATQPDETARQAAAELRCIDPNVARFSGRTGGSGSEIPAATTAQARSRCVLRPSMGERGRRSGTALPHYGPGVGQSVVATTLATTTQNTTQVPDKTGDPTRRTELGLSSRGTE